MAAIRAKEALTFFPYYASSVKPAMVTGEIRVTTKISNDIMVTKAKSKYVLSNSNN
ncbi:MAG TPA: hypothetical protein VIW25_11110 [Nitrososphaeraceae archaeon]